MRSGDKERMLPVLALTIAVVCPILMSYDVQLFRFFFCCIINFKILHIFTVVYGSGLQARQSSTFILFVGSQVLLMSMQFAVFIVEKLFYDWLLRIVVTLIPSLG